MERRRILMEMADATEEEDYVVQLDDDECNELKGGMAHPLEEGATKIPDDHSLQQLQDPVKLASENKTTPLSELPKSPDYKDRTPEAGYMIPALGARFATGALIGGAIGGSSSSDHDTAVRNALVGGMTMGALAIIGPELA